MTEPNGANGFRVLDLSFVGDEDGWAFGVVPCRSTTSGTCTAMRRTTDGGRHWTSLPAPPANVPGVEHLRFATMRIGYAFGPGTLLMTTDGGAHWTRQAGGAAALESLDGNVIRVRPDMSGCELGCTYTIETAAIGSMTWTERARVVFSWSIALARGGHDAYVLASPHFSGNAPSTLYRSADDGSTWQITHQPCRSAGGYRTLAITAGSARRAGLLCTVPGKPAGFVAVSVDGGAHFRARAATPLLNVLAAGAELAGDLRTVLLVALGQAASGHTVLRSTDGGRSWHGVRGITGGVIWAGCESNTVGRIVGANGHTIWTTHDAGAHWTPAAL